MKKIEEIRAYIRKNPIPRPDLDEISISEIEALLSSESGLTRVGAVHFAYEYGRSKGYQIGKGAGQ